jgi:hypothetical protein
MRGSIPPLSDKSSLRDAKKKCDHFCSSRCYLYWSVWRWATGWTAVVLFPGRGRKSLSTPQCALGSTQSPIQWVPGLFPRGVKGPGLEADHSPPCTAEVKYGGAYLHAPYVFMVWFLIKHRDSAVGIATGFGLDDRGVEVRVPVG